MTEPRLFDGPDAATHALGGDGPWVAERIEAAWQDYEPYADSGFASEIRSAIRALGQSHHDCPNRERAWHAFMRRYWELDMGCSLLSHGYALVPRTGLTSDGPDFLAKSANHRIWIECIVPGRGEGENAIPDYIDGKCHEVPDDEIKLRLLSAFWTKAKKRDCDLAKGIVTSEDTFIIAINGSCLPSHLIDDSPPRFVRCLLGMQYHQVHVNLTTGKFSEAPMTSQSTILNSKQAPVESTAFQQARFAGIAGVVYSDVTPYAAGSSWGADYAILHNPLAAAPLAVTECEWMTQWRFSREGRIGTVTRMEPKS